MYQLYIDSTKAYDSVRRELLYNILTEFGTSMNLVRLIKMCLTATYSRVWVGKHLSVIFPIENGLKQGDVLSLLLSNLALEYTISRLQAHQEGLKLLVTHQLLVNANGFNILVESKNTIMKNGEAY
jgi:hypothetical protein